jgi:superfamily II DNA or RNA helicase
MNNQQNNYIDLKINGRLFPLWVLHNFKKYKLKPIIKLPDTDPCINYGKDNMYELREYQAFIGAYLDYKSPYTNILLYHGLGAGKTATAINVYNILFNYTPNWNVFILIKASLKNQPWLSDLKTWLNKDQYETRWNNIKFIHYDAPNADRDFLNKINESDSTKKNLYIIDEVHNFITNVYNNIINKAGKRAQIIYDYLIQEKKEYNDTRIILISATPAVNTPYELALIFNLLRYNTFPTSEVKFKEIYITNNANIETLNIESKNMFQRRIMGLVSYYKGSTSDLYARKNIIQKNLIMSDYQLQVYKYYEDIEKKLESSKTNFSKKGIYKAYTRQASNFVFPIVDDISGESRPRPSKFKLTEKQIEILMLDKSRDDIDKETMEKYQLYLNIMNKYIKIFDKWLELKAYEDKNQKLSLEEDINIFKINYKYKFNEFWENYKNKSNLLKAMYDCSCKMTAILFYSMRSDGPVLVYSNYVKMEGLEIFKIYLKYFNYSLYGDTNNINNLYYTEFTGNIDKNTRNRNLYTFNNKKNKDGSLIRIILISPTGAEGISLRNIRQVHIMEPYWNEIRIQQLIGRAIRQCSHRDIPINERFVDIYRYNATTITNIQTTDQIIQELALEKYNLIETFLLSIKEVAIDCELFKEHNMIDDEYQCFKFNEKSYFDKFISPAYKEDIYFDKKLDNGSGSINSITKKIKVLKIKICYILNNSITNTQSSSTAQLENHSFSDYKYSLPLDAWYNPDTCIVYDFELKYPIGKIKIENDLPVKINKQTYIVDNIIIIPTIRKI